MNASAPEGGAWASSTTRSAAPSRMLTGAGGAGPAGFCNVFFWGSQMAGSVALARWLDNPLVSTTRRAVHTCAFVSLFGAVNWAAALRVRPRPPPVRDLTGVLPFAEARNLRRKHCAPRVWHYSRYRASPRVQSLVNQWTALLFQLPRGVWSLLYSVGLCAVVCRCGY